MIYFGQNEKGEEMAQIRIGNQMVEHIGMLSLQNNSGELIYKYKGNSGLCYKYDLSNLMDRQKYEMDLSSQMSDSVKIDSRILLDRGMNQYGGGIQ